MITTGSAQQDDDDSEVSVTVSDQVAVDVRPTDLSFSGISPGTVTESSDDGFGSIEIENVGSQSVDQIWVGSENPQSDPFGSGVSEDYNSGNFVQVATETASDGYDVSSGISQSNEDMHFARRHEFHEDPVPTYIQTDLDDAADATGVGSTTVALTDGDLEDVRVGRLRAGDVEFFYAVYHNSDGCDASTADSNAALLVGETPHTPDQVGTSDFTASGPEDFSVYNIDSNDDPITIDGVDHAIVESIDLTIEDEETDQVSGTVTRGYDGFVHCNTAGNDVTDDDQIIRSRYNPNIGDSEVTGGEQSYVLQGEDLEPGSHFPIDINLETPLGVSEGGVTSGSITVFVSNTA